MTFKNHYDSCNKKVLVGEYPSSTFLVLREHII